MWLEPGVTSSTALALQNEYTQGQVARSDWLREVRGKASEGHVRRRPSLRVVRSGLGATPENTLAIPSTLLAEYATWPSSWGFTMWSAGVANRQLI